MLIVVRQILLSWRLLRDGRVPVHAKLALILPLLYVLSPLDFVPDFVVGLGQLDDLGILLVGMRMLETLSPADIVTEHRANLGRVNSAQVFETIMGRPHQETEGEREQV